MTSRSRTPARAWMRSQKCGSSNTIALYWIFVCRSETRVDQMSIGELLGHDDIEIENAGTGVDALAKMREQQYDCVVLDLRLQIGNPRRPDEHRRTSWPR